MDCCSLLSQTCVIILKLGCGSWKGTQGDYISISRGVEFNRERPPFTQALGAACRLISSKTEQPRCEPQLFPATQLISRRRACLATEPDNQEYGTFLLHHKQTHSFCL